MADTSVIHLVEIWANRNLTKLNKGRCKVLHLERNKPMHQYILETDRLESSFAEKALGVLVNIKLNVSSNVPLQQRRPTVSQAASGRSLPAGQGR